MGKAMLLTLVIQRGKLGLGSEEGILGWGLGPGLEFEPHQPGYKTPKTPLILNSNLPVHKFLWETKKADTNLEKGWDTLCRNYLT